MAAAEVSYADATRLARVIGPVLTRLYPQNPDIVLGREARRIAEALLAAGLVLTKES